jgi:two-component system sensor histidine kinase/response regulator
LRVLVVDDNSTNRQILRHQLLAWRMQPDFAEGGAQALKMMLDAAWSGKAYSLALLDFQMPEMDGLQLAAAIKSERMISMTRLVLLTSHGQLLSPVELEEAGIDSCIIKPAKQSRLFECLIDAMDRADTQSTPADAAALTLAPSDVPSPTGGMRIL